MKLGSGKVVFPQGNIKYLDGSATGKSLKTLDEALAKNAECGCGVECLCYGYLRLPVRDTTTGEITSYAALYFTTPDGGTTINTVVEDINTAETNIQALKDLS